MHRRRPGPNVRRQRAFGLALILVILVLGSVAFLVRGFTPASLQVERDKVTERALAQAKAALIGRAARDDNRPGSLPCPDTDGDGVAELFAGNACPAYTGLLPWRTLGLTELRDGSGERLWYALSPNFRDHSDVQPLNSDTRGDVVLQSASGTLVEGTLVALVIAPERAMGGQARPSANAGDYLEFVDPTPAPTGGPPPDYVYRRQALSNDSILPISHRDLFAVVDQAVFSRMKQTVVPKMQALANKWTRYPFARPFDPTAIDAPGVPNLTEGSLAWSPNAALNPTWTGGAVNPTSGPGSLDSFSCTPSSNQLTCTIFYSGGSIGFEIVGSATKAGLSFTDITWTASETLGGSPAWSGVSTSPSGDATARFFNATLPGTGTSPATVTLTLGLANWADRASATPDPATEWFVKNQWYGQVYYAVSVDAAFGGSGGCAVGTSCLSVTNPLTLATTNNNQVIMVLAGRALNGTPRPSTTLTEYLEGANQSQFDRAFESGPRTFTRNDKIAILAP